MKVSNPIPMFPPVKRTVLPARFTEDIESLDMLSSGCVVECFVLLEIRSKARSYKSSSTEK
jgi:hypothetical protein